MNRGVSRLSIFGADKDYQAFLTVMAETRQRVPCDVFAFCLMPNHWHLLLSPREDAQLSEFMRLLTVTHTQRWHAFFETAGTGAIYQGRFKAFPVKCDEHFLTVARYIERNALRANIVKRAEHWKWSSLRLGNPVVTAKGSLPLSPWPVEKPQNWIEVVNKPDKDDELAAIRQSVAKGCPFGDAEWQREVSKQLQLDSSLRARGRPRRPRNS